MARIFITTGFLVTAFIMSILVAAIFIETILVATKLLSPIFGEKLAAGVVAAMTVTWRIVAGTVADFGRAGV